MLHSTSTSPTTSPSSPYADPSLVIFYNYLRKFYRSLRMEQPVIAPDIECAFIYQCASAYERLGCPGLALQIIRTTPLTVAAGASGPGTGLLDDLGRNRTSENVQSGTDLSMANDNVNWPLPPSPGADTTIKLAESSGHRSTDWGAPASTLASAADAVLDWGAPASSLGSNNAEAFDWGAPASRNTTTVLDWGGSPATAATSNFDDEYEAFKRSLGGGGYEEMLEDLDIEETSEFESDKSTPFVADQNVAGLDKKGQFRFELETRNVRLYQWMLAMRIIQVMEFSGIF